MIIYECIFAYNVVNFLSCYKNFIQLLKFLYDKSVIYWFAKFLYTWQKTIADYKITSKYISVGWNFLLLSFRMSDDIKSNKIDFVILELFRYNAIHPFKCLWSGFFQVSYIPTCLFAIFVSLDWTFSLIFLTPC